MLFTTLNDMVSVLMASMADNSFPTKLRQFVQPSLLIVDEVGYLPVSEPFQDARHARISFSTTLRSIVLYGLAMAFMNPYSLKSVIIGSST